MDSEVLYLFEVAPTCRIDDCARPIKNKREQLCDPHYKRLWRHGDPLAGGPMRPWVRAGKPVQDFPDGTRSCNTCEKRLPLNLFHRDSNGTRGRRASCAECEKAKARSWYEANCERQTARENARRAADPDKYRKWDMERYARHRAKRIELATEHAHRRRLRMLAGEYDRTVTRANLRKQYGDQCFYCECAMDFGRYKRGETPGNLASIEHVHPISKGGAHTWDNVVLACLDCNLRKNAQPVDEFLRRTA